ncbi:MAG TPA: ABC transporter permease subunit, partial [Acidimicrobiia bacterium]|nr:ABC transporter permease subunit [Acidimicrobiia bacterium]
MTTEPAPAATRTPFWRNTGVLRVFVQLVGLGVIAFIFYILWFNLTNNLRRQGIPTSFDFLDRPGGVNIADADISAGASVSRFLWLGIKNTFALAIFGIPLLTIIGVIVGVARLSTNWVVAKLAALYVEVLRNTPPLLVIFLVFYVVILPLPTIADPATPLGLFVITNRRIAIPWFESVGSNAQLLWMITAALAVIAVGIGWWRTRLNDRTGTPHRRILWGGGFLIAGAVATWALLGQPVQISVPQPAGRIVEGGLSGLGAYFAVLIALVLYTASHVAEIVRGSILAVPRGQGEAANALALSGLQRLRYVILPQAMRIAIPPVINQYLNYVKNTSLAIAIGYAEITTIE